MKTHTGLTLRPYQEAGWHWATPKKSWLLADDPGLGKTCQTIAVMNDHREWRRILIVCPAHLRINWRTELDMWLTSDADITISSYEGLHKVPSQPWDFMVCDEAHYLKNPKSLRSRRSRSIQAGVRAALTGTPILGRPRDLAGILIWLRPDIIPTPGALRDFEIRYCGAALRKIWFRGRGGVVKSKLVWDNSGASNLSELAMRMSNLMLRRTAEEVLPELPPAIHVVHELDVVEDEFLDRSAPMASQRLQLGIRKTHESLGYICGILEEVDKLAIFCHHREVINQLQSSLTDFNPVSIMGGVDENLKDAAVKSFQKDPDTRVFIGQMQAAGTGITLTAACHIVLLESDWSPAIMDQVVRRLRRIGQQRRVTVHHIVFHDSLEESMARNLANKQNNINALLGD